MSDRGSRACVLAVAGLDPSGGAGLLADAEAIAAIGARPLCVPTALTVQTKARARELIHVEVNYLREATLALLEEEPVRAIKLGMLGTPEAARLLAELLPGELPLVIDPVLAASSGAPLFRGAPEELRESLGPLWSCALLTPNLPEALALLGEGERPRVGALLGGSDFPRPAPDLEQLARALLEQGAGAVLLKGGHAAGAEAADLLAREGGQTLRFASPRLLGPRRLSLGARGTGCRLASAIAAGLALGTSLEDAIEAGRKFVGGYLVREGREPG